MGDDPINPSHYRGNAVDGFIEQFGLTFRLGSVVKYISRAGFKVPSGRRKEDSKLEDLRKAQWYLTEEIKQLEREQAPDGSGYTTK